MSKQKRLSAFMWVNSVTSSCLSGQADCYSAGLFPFSGGRILPFLWPRCKERIFAVKQEQVEKGDGVEKCSETRPFSSAFLEVRRGFFFRGMLGLRSQGRASQHLRKIWKWNLCACVFMDVCGSMLEIHSVASDPPVGLNLWTPHANPLMQQLFCWATASRKWRSESCSFQEE